MDEHQKGRIIEARAKRRARCLAAGHKGRHSEGEPRGSGPPNAHGMPELPVGQVRTEKWPVLDLGADSEIPLDTWRLVMDGAVEDPVELNWKEFMSLPQVEDVSDFHCVTTWSTLGIRWNGVRAGDALALVMPIPQARHVMCHAHDEYTTNLSLREVLRDDVLLVRTYEGAPLPREHGGPVRMVTPQLYGWKGAKWIQRIEVMVEDRPRFWEARGYSNTARPWLDDRYS